MLLSVILILCAAALLIGNHLLLKWRQSAAHVALPAPRAAEVSWYRAAGNYPRVTLDSEHDTTLVWQRDAISSELLAGGVHPND